MTIRQSGADRHVFIGVGPYDCEYDCFWLFLGALQDQFLGT